MTLDLQQAAQRRMRRALFVLVGVVLVLVAALVVIAVTGGGSDNKGAPAPQASPTAPEPVPTVPEDDGGYVAPAETVKLPDGASTVGDLPVKFPRTAEGAAAMGVAAMRNAYGNGWDAAKVEAGITAYSAAEYRDTMAATAADSVKQNREYAGIPASGSVPAGATLNAWPIGVQWEEKTDGVDVLVLLRVTHSPGASKESKTNIYVVPTRAIWEAGDWKLEMTPQSNNLPDPVDIGTDRFNTDGWKSIQEGDRL